MKKQKTKNEFIKIPKKAMKFIAPVVAITAILIARGNPGSLLLFLIGIVSGVMIGKTYEEEK